MLKDSKLEKKLRSLGADKYNLWLPETRMLPKVIDPDEKLLGIVYGRYKQLSRDGSKDKIIGRGALAATDRRIILIDRKPLFVKEDNISYKEIRTIAYIKVSIAGTIMLRMEVGDFRIRTFNHKCARQFVSAVEAEIFKTRSSKYSET